MGCAKQIQTGEGQFGDAWLLLLKEPVKIRFITDIYQARSGPDRNFH
jgi:hypothetical protein